MPSLLLASSSAYRRELLSRLRLPFQHQSPDIDEAPLPQELPQHLALRLAEQKARALAEHHPDHLIIGSDQVAVLGDMMLGKPGDFTHAAKQLMAASGKTVTFLTGIALLNSQTGRIQTDCVPFKIRFRTLSDEQIERYLHLEQPYDCAGSFKAEGLGISLFQSMEGEDFTSLIGLPLIRLVDMLKNEGVNIP